MESARKLKAAQAELETASKVSSKQWSLIQAAGTQLKAEIAKNSNLIKENEALKTVSDKYQVRTLVVGFIYRVGCEGEDVNGVSDEWRAGK